jgi:hypothetical protein
LPLLVNIGVGMEVGLNLQDNYLPWLAMDVDNPHSLRLKQLNSVLCYLIDGGPVKNGKIVMRQNS